MATRGGDDIVVEGGGASGSESETDTLTTTMPRAWKKALLSCRGYRGHFTKRLNAGRKLVEFGEINPSSTVAAALQEEKAALNRAYKNVCKAYQVLFDMDPPEREFDELERKLDSINDCLLYTSPSPRDS